MTNYVKVGNLQVAEQLADFINTKVLPGSGVEQEGFWTGFDQLIHELAPENKALLARRDELQGKINTWHKENKANFEFESYKAFLQDIGYLEPKIEDYHVETENVDDEVAFQAGPQLVVPVSNARYAINAANARWGSLYDALYGTDVISDEDGAEAGKGYNPVRGNKVIAYAKDFLNKAAGLQQGSHTDATSYVITDSGLEVTLLDGTKTTLAQPDKLVGYQGNASEPTAVLLKNNDLHIEIQIDRSHPIGKDDTAGVKDIYLESAITTIMDCEDSVAAVDAEEKDEVYSNWFGLMKGDLVPTI